MASERRWAQVDFKITTSPEFLDLPPLHKGFLSFLMEHYHNFPPGLLDASTATLADEFGVEKHEAEKLMTDLSGEGDIGGETVWVEHDSRARLTLVWPSLREPTSSNEAVGWLNLTLKARPDSQLATQYLQSVVAAARQQDWYLKLEEKESFRRDGLQIEESDREGKKKATTWQRLKALFSEVEALGATESDTLSTGINPALKQQEQEQEEEQKEKTEEEGEGEEEGARGRGGGRGSSASSSSAGAAPSTSNPKTIPIEGKRAKRRVGQPKPPPTLMAEVFQHLQSKLPSAIQRDATPLSDSGRKLNKLWLEGESLDRLKASIDAYEEADWQPATARKWLASLKAIAWNNNLVALVSEAKVSDFSSRSITLDFRGTSAAAFLQDEENFGKPIRSAFEGAWGRVEFILEDEAQQSAVQ